MSTTISQTDHQAGHEAGHEAGAPDDGFSLDADEGAVNQGDAAPEQMHEPAAPVVVRRNAGFAALVGAAASAIAIAYLWRATQSAAPLDWALCGVMAAIGAIYLTHLVDARTPLLVADDLGVRIRLGRQWRGLPWDAVEAVVVTTRRGPLKDGRLVFAPHNIERALDGLDGRGRRAAAMNQKMYGAALAVPLGLTTRVSAPGSELAGQLAALSEERADVIEATSSPEVDQAVEPEVEPAEDSEVGHYDSLPLAELAEQAEEEPSDSAYESYESYEPDAAEPDLEETEPKPRRSVVPGLATFVSRVGRGRRKDVDAHLVPEETDPEALSDEEWQPEPEEQEEPDTAEPTDEPDRRRGTARARHPRAADRAVSVRSPAADASTRLAGRRPGRRARRPDRSRGPGPRPRRHPPAATAPGERCASPHRRRRAGRARPHRAAGRQGAADLQAG